MTQVPPEPIDDPAIVDPTRDPRRLVLRLVVALAGLFLVVAIAVAVLGGPITDLSEAFVVRFGLPGVFLGALLCDLVAVPKEPVLLLGYQGGIAFVPISLVSALATLIAALTGWTLGQRFGRVPFVRRRLDRTPVGPFLHRHGWKAIAIAAIVPFPFATLTWAAGAVHLPLPEFLRGAVFRVPKTWISFTLVVGGVSLGTLIGGR